MLRHLLRAAAVAALSMACEAVDDRPACLARGTYDSATIFLTTEDNTWPDGAYAIELTVDGAKPSRLCRFEFPRDLSTSPLERPSCAIPEVAHLEFAPNCVRTEYPSAETLVVECTPLPGEWIWTLQSSGTPTQVDVSVARDGSELFHGVVYPSYLPDEQNGTGCGFVFTSVTELRIPRALPDSE